MKPLRLLSHALAVALFAGAAGSLAHADTAVYTSAFLPFLADDEVAFFSVTSTSTQNYSFFTTSYGGGINVDGTRTPAGGFVPVLTLFDSTGAPIGSDGGSGMCRGSAVADTSTGICNDALLQETIGPGSYTLALSEFPNVAIGNLGTPFLFAGQTTGSLCGNPSGRFLETDLAPCVQRNGNFAVDVTTGALPAPIPEPPTWMLVLPAAAGIVVLGKRQLA